VKTLERALLALLLAGCRANRGEMITARDAPRAVTEPPEPVRASPPTSSVAGPRSVFRVAAFEGPGHSLEPCRVRGVTLIRDGQRFLVSAEDGVRDEGSIPPATPDASPAVVGRPTSVLGQWPDAAWLVTWDDDAKQDRRHAYRWTGHEWARAARWSGLPASLALFHDGLLVDGVDDDRPNVPHTRVALFGRDGSEERLPPSHLLETAAGQVTALASVDGSLFVIATSGGPARLVAERLGDDGADDLQPIASGAASAHLWVKTARDVVAFGGHTHADEEPVLSHYDGARWSPLDAPPGVDIVVAYDRGASGTERAFAYRGEELSYWERAAGARWRPIPLPALDEGESIHGHWLTDDDAWLSVFSPAGKGRLLRERPVTHVYRAGPSPAIEAVVPDSDLLPAAPRDAPAQRPSLDPTPFHDAVVGYASEAALEVPPALRLCATPGRTLVCGVSEAPLVSTADGIVGPVGDRIGSARREEEVIGATLRSRPTPPALRGGKLPAGVDAVVAYDLPSHGTQRLLGRRGEALALFERAGETSEWKPVVLPTLARGERIADAWLANDDAWLLVYPEDMSKDPPRLLRMKPVKRVWTYPRRLPSPLGW
jgi:hypothetical protein